MTGTHQLARPSCRHALLRLLLAGLGPLCMLFGCGDSDAPAGETDPGFVDPEVRRQADRIRVAFLPDPGTPLLWEIDQPLEPQSSGFASGTPTSAVHGPTPWQATPEGRASFGAPTTLVAAVGPGLEAIDLRASAGSSAQAPIRRLLAADIARGQHICGLESHGDLQVPASGVAIAHMRSDCSDGRQPLVRRGVRLEAPDAGIFDALPVLSVHRTTQGRLQGFLVPGTDGLQVTNPVFGERRSVTGCDLSEVRGIATIGTGLRLVRDGLTVCRVDLEAASATRVAHVPSQEQIARILQVEDDLYVVSTLLPWNSVRRLRRFASDTPAQGQLMVERDGPLAGLRAAGSRLYFDGDGSRFGITWIDRRGGPVVSLGLQPTATLVALDETVGRVFYNAFEPQTGLPDLFVSGHLATGGTANVRWPYSQLVVLPGSRSHLVRLESVAPANVTGGIRPIGVALVSVAGATTEPLGTVDTTDELRAIGFAQRQPDELWQEEPYQPAWHPLEDPVAAVAIYHQQPTTGLAVSRCLIDTVRVRMNCTTRRD